QVIFATTPDNATIDFQPNRFRLYVVRRQHIRERQIQIGHPEIGYPIVGLLRGKFQKVTVQYRSEDLHMAGLPLREEVSRSSEVEISLADGEACAWSAELLQNGQTLFRLFRMRFGQQIREGTRSASSDPTSELMQLRQTELFGPADDDGVRPRNIEAALH